MHVFQNLLSNSLKYRDPCRTPEIRISAAAGAGEWTICVEDNGIGFQQQYAERIFGLFNGYTKRNTPAPAWAWPSASVSWRGTGDESGPKAGPVREPLFTSPCPNREYSEHSHFSGGR